MQKKIIVLAIAAALTAPALAYAEATVYGQVNLAMDRLQDGNASSKSYNQLNSYGSRIGFKGSEALDGGMGMSVIWGLEGSVGVDNGTAGTTTSAYDAGPPTIAVTTTNQLFDREATVGLKSDSLGTVTLGRQDTPYKTSTRGLDVFGDTVADNRNIIGANHDVAVSNGIKYTSPSMSGFSVALAGMFGAEDAAPAAVPAADKKGTAMSLAAMYSMDSIYATLAIDNAKAGDAGTGDLGATGVGGTAVDDKAAATKFGVGYSMDAITVNAVIEQMKVTKATTSTDIKNTNIYLGGKFNVSSTDAVKLAFAKRGDTKVGSATATDNVTQIALGYDHGMSKNTTVYALYSKVTQKATGAADPSVISLGVKHAF